LQYYKNRLKIKNMDYGHILKSCRMCGGVNLYKFLDLGFAPPSDLILSQEDLNEPEILFPLNVLQCQDCGLTQLGYVVSPKLLYGNRYKYESSMTESGKRHFFSMADSICRKLNLEKNSLVIEVGRNVGILLEGFKRNGMQVLGIDPAVEIYKIANDRNIETWHEFFGPEVADRISLERGKAKVITGTNVFAHIDDKEGLLKALDILLDQDGIFVFEVPYLPDLIENLEYDTIYLEHLEYISVKPLVQFFEKHGMEVFDIEKYDIHGKSIRVFVSKNGRYPVSESVARFLALEDQKKIYKKETLDEFSKKVALHKEELTSLLKKIKSEGKTIAGISAPAKGNTILNYCKIGTDLVDYITEKSLIKKGNFTPGMHIPIVSEEKMFESGKIPDYGIIFAWNFAEEIIRNNSAFLDMGGKFIIPIPNPQIREKEKVKIKKLQPSHSDSRGVISDILNNPVNHVGFITTESGAVRANHYHKLSTQYNYIISGKFEFVSAPANNPSAKEKIIVETGDLITIPPFNIHKFKAIDKAQMIDIISESRAGTGYEDDVVRVEFD